MGNEQRRKGKPRSRAENMQGVWRESRGAQPAWSEEIRDVARQAGGNRISKAEATRLRREVTRQAGGSHRNFGTGDLIGEFTEVSTV